MIAEGFPLASSSGNAPPGPDARRARQGALLSRLVQPTAAPTLPPEGNEQRARRPPAPAYGEPLVHARPSRNRRRTAVMKKTQPQQPRIPPARKRGGRGRSATPIPGVRQDPATHGCSPEGFLSEKIGVAYAVLPSPADLPSLAPPIPPANGKPGREAAGGGAPELPPARRGNIEKNIEQPPGVSPALRPGRRRSPPSPRPHDADFMGKRTGGLRRECPLPSLFICANRLIGL